MAEGRLLIYHDDSTFGRCGFMIECTTAFWLGLSLLGVFEHSQAILAITNRWFSFGSGRSSTFEGGVEQMS